MNVEQYRNRFFNLMESKLGDAKPLISEEDECVKPTEPDLFVLIKTNLIKAGFNVEEGAVACDEIHGEFILSKGEDKIKVNTYFDKDIQKSMINIYHTVCGRPQQSNSVDMTKQIADLITYYNENVASCLWDNTGDKNPYLISQ